MNEPIEILGWDGDDFYYRRKRDGALVCLEKAKVTSVQSENDCVSPDGGISVQEITMRFAPWPMDVDISVPAEQVTAELEVADDAR